MRHVWRIILLLSVASNLTQAQGLWPAQHPTCGEASLGISHEPCSQNTSFYVDQNGNCGCLAEQQIIAPSLCRRTQRQCLKSHDKIFSDLYQYRHQDIVEIIHAGCHCESISQNANRPVIKPNAKQNNTSLFDENLFAIDCSVTDLVGAITAANLLPSGTIILATDCSYLIDTPATANEALPLILGDITMIGDHTTIARDPMALSSFRILTVDNQASLTLKNLIIENGDTTGLGGGIQNNGTLILDQVKMQNNNAANGGAISVSGGATASIVGSEFFFNTATSVGGGGLINFGELIISESRIQNNIAPINGGGINTQPGGLTNIIVSYVTNNSSNSLGGAFSNLGALNITDTLIQSNTGSAGGGIATGNDFVNLLLVNIDHNFPDNCSPLNVIEGCVD